MNFGMILGGIAKGAGEGLGMKVKADREARLAELAEERADRRSEREMQFRSQEAEIGRDAQVAENIRSEGVAASERQKDRDIQGNEVVLGAKGEAGILNKSTGKVIPVTGPDGKEFKLLPKASDSTKEIRNAEYMLEHGIAKNPNEAWTKANRLADKDPAVIRDTMYRDWIRTLAGTGEASEIEAAADAATDRYMKEHYPEEEEDAEPAEPTEGPGNVIPPDPAARIPGKVYKTGKGELYRWTVKPDGTMGWEPA